MLITRLHGIGIKLVKAAGFTLVELLIVVAIAGILVGIAIPSFIDMIRSNRLTASANDLVTALNIARSEAIKRGLPVVVRTKGAATQWEGGWDIFVNTNGPSGDDGVFVFDGVDILVRTYDALPEGYTLRTSNATDYKNYAVYMPNGLSKSIVGDVFSLCSHAGNNLPKQRTITISPTGRPSVAVVNRTCP